MRLKNKWFQLTIAGLLAMGVTPCPAMHVKQVMIWPMGSTLTLYQSACRAALLTAAGLRGWGYPMVDSHQQGSFVHQAPVQDLARKARQLEADAVVLVEVTHAERRDLPCETAAETDCGSGYRVKVKLSLINAYTDHLAWSKSAEGEEAGHDEAYTIACRLNELLPKLNKFLETLPN